MDQGRGRDARSSAFIYLLVMSKAAKITKDIITKDIMNTQTAAAQIRNNAANMPRHAMKRVIATKVGSCSTGSCNGNIGAGACRT
jgi:hypothetical protein